jgi:hypothetical protein
MSLIKKFKKINAFRNWKSLTFGKKIKLYSIYTEETNVLKEIFINTIQDDWEINLVSWGQAGEEGNWGTKSFGKLMRKKIEFVIETLEENRGNIIIFSDIDIQFFGKCSKLIKKSLRNNDLLFQSERWPQKEINAGFIVVKCNDRTIEFFRSVADIKLENLEFFEQSAMSEILNGNDLDLKWDVLPSQFWAMSHGGNPPLDIVLHHANCTAPTVKDGKTIGSIELKLEQYKMLREYLSSNKGEESPVSERLSEKKV